MSERSPGGRREQEQLREQTILRAAIEELAASDYGGLTVEQVAARAGVNKTTVYRKWETKNELIRAALLSVFETYRIGPSAGDLRTDLLRIAHNLLDFTLSSEGRSLMRLGLLKEPEPELAEIAQDLNARKLADLARLLDAAVARGEVAADVDIILLMDMLWGAVHVRSVTRHDPIDDAALERMVDLVMRAAASRPSRPPPSRSAEAIPAKPKQRGRPVR